MDGAELSDTRSPEFLASTNSCQMERGEGGGGEGVAPPPEKVRVTQMLKDFASQSPKLLKAASGKVKGVGGAIGRANTCEFENLKTEVGRITLYVNYFVIQSH